MAVSVLNGKGKTLITHQMDMLFTHFGLSGPAILRCSQFVVKERMKNGNVPVDMKIDSLPSMNEEQVFQLLNSTVKEDPKKQVNNSLKGIVPERWLIFLFNRAGIAESDIGATMAADKLRALAKLLKAFTMTVNGSQPMEKAFVTGGGVSVKEIVPKTMASRKKAGLYFCGEILDIHGYTGGYNITSALVTGRIAGMNAGEYATDLS